MRRFWLLLLLLVVEPWDARCQQANSYMQGSVVAGDTGTHTFAGTVLKGVTITWNTGTTARYLMVFDGVAAPSNGATTSCNPVAAAQPAKCLAYCVYVPSSTTAPGFISVDFTEHPLALRNGATVSLSSGAGCGTYTVDTGTDWFYAQ